MSDNEKPLIAFIDDEPDKSMRYVRELLNKFDTHYFDEVSSGLAFCKDHPKLRCIVLDMIVPPPEGTDYEEVEGGLETGVWFLRNLKSFLEDNSVAVVVLTNRNITLVRDAVSKLELPKILFVCKTKTDVPSWFLPVLVQQMIDKSLT